MNATGSRVFALAYGRTGNWLALASGRIIRIYDSVTYRELRQLEGHEDTVRGVAFSPDDRFLVSVGEDKMVTLQREGSDVVLHSRPVTPTSVSDQGHSAVLVRHGPGPGTHTLEGVYVEILKLVLFLDESGHTKPIDKMFASVIRVPIS